MLPPTVPLPHPSGKSSGDGELGAPHSLASISLGMEDAVARREYRALVERPFTQASPGADADRRSVGMTAILFVVSVEDGGKGK